MKAVDLSWNTKFLLRIKMGHKYFGLFMTLAIQIAVMSGINKSLYKRHKKLGDILMFVNICFWFFILAAGEIYY